MSASLQKPKPGLAAAILIPLFIWIVASVVAVVFLVMAIGRASDVADDFARVPGGEATEVELTESGDYRIWLDQSEGGERAFASATATISGPDGDVTAETYVGDYEYGDLEAVLTFEAPSAGTYTFEIVENGSDAPTSAEFAIGKDDPLDEIGVGILLMIVIGGAGFVVALIVLIIMLVRRGRSKRRINQANLGSGGYGGGGYGSPPGGYPGGTSPQGGATW